MYYLAGSKIDGVRISVAYSTKFLRTVVTLHVITNQLWKRGRY